MSVKFSNIISESLKDIWYHGTPDARKVEKMGGFEKRSTSLTYYEDIDKYIELQKKMQDAREQGNENLYFKYIDQVGDLEKRYTFESPVFFSNKKAVAKTYANPHRAFDYQEAVPKVFSAIINCDNPLTVKVMGDRFRYLDYNKIKRGFLAYGFSEEEFERTYLKFNYFSQNKKGIKTDMLIGMASYLGVDCLDFVGVLDSYHGGNIKSTVRAVMNKNYIKIIKQ